MIGKFIRDNWDGWLVYACTLLGVVVAQYIPAFKAARDFDISLRWPYLVVAATIALVFVLQDESSGGQSDETRAGRRRNLRRRLAHAIAQGIAWTTITN